MAVKLADTRPALTLWPEWAYAIAHLGKRVENRTWSRPSLVGQWLCIHGGQHIGGHRQSDQGAGDVAEVLSIARRAGAIGSYDRAALFHHLQMARNCEGKIVAVAKVTGFTRSSDSPWFFGPWGWELDEVRVLPDPVPIKGSQGIWLVAGPHLDAIRRQL